jgi:Cof subfamily protein (haloacid dehalogenase superfamily)
MNQAAIRLVLADVDGTLVTDDKVLTETARSVVRDLRLAGVAFAVTSSRPPRGLRMLIKPLALQVPLAGLNGGLYVNPDLSVIECQKLDLVTAKQTVTLLLDQGLDVWVYTETDWLVRDRAGPHVAREAWILQFDPTVVAAFTDVHLAHAVKIVGVSDDLDLVAACEGHARAVLGDTASAARSNAYFLDVTNPQANKGAVVLTLAKLLDIAPSQIATIGDMPNDVMMFAKSGLSIAMGNASDAVKAKANHVTASNEDDGFASAVRRFVLPPPPRGPEPAPEEEAL